MILLMFVCVGVPAVAGPPYNVDDPGTSEPNRTNVYLLLNSSQIHGSESQQLPQLIAGYGLTDKLELDFGAALTSSRARGFGCNAGLGDTSLGFKYRFVEETKRQPQLGFVYSLKLPTASRERGLGTGVVDHSCWLCAAKSFGCCSLFSNVGYNFLGGTAGKNNLFYGAGLSAQVTEKLIVGAQLYGNTSSAPGNRAELAYGVGLVYNFAPDRSFVMQLGRSAEGVSDLNLTVGISFTLGRRPKKP